MWATYWDTLQEVGGRRVLLIFAGLAILVGVLFNRPITFGSVNGVDVIYQGPASMGPWPLAVPQILGQLTGFTGTFWAVLMIIAGCPLFVLTFERGWRELTLSKGTVRWQILLGRYLGITTLFFSVALMTHLPVALRLWWHTGVPTWHVTVGVLIETFSFAALLAVGALTSIMGDGGVALPIITPFAILTLSGLLLNRQGLYADYIKSKFAQHALDWLYTILPKCAELDATAARFIQSSTISTSWPLWTTGLFILATLTLTLWSLERKSF